MPALDIFELETPPGAPADATGALFESNLAWLRTYGVACVRHEFNLDRAAFYANEVVRPVLEAQGTAALPLVLVDGTIMSAGAYPSRPELARALGLGGVADEVYTARLLAAGTALGLALARHDAAAIEAAHARLQTLGVTRETFAQAVSEFRDFDASNPPDPQVAEALDRLAARGTLRPPRGMGCCG
jgi:hypothetical protein